MLYCLFCTCISFLYFFVQMSKLISQFLSNHPVHFCHLLHFQLLQIITGVKYGATRVKTSLLLFLDCYSAKTMPGPMFGLPCMPQSLTLFAAIHCIDTIFCGKIVYTYTHIPVYDSDNLLHSLYIFIYLAYCIFINTV